MKCCVIDDEPLAAGLIAGYIEKTPFMELAGVFHSAGDAVKTVMTQQVDVVFLDINMPMLNGLEFAALVPAGVKVVFTTAFDSHAIEAFRVGAVDYLLKPISFKEFTETALRLRQHFEVDESYADKKAPAADGKILVKKDHKFEQIDTTTILYAEGLKDYVKILRTDGLPAHVALTSMRSLEAHLPAGKFLRIHRSYIINTEQIKTIGKSTITMSNDKALPIGESYRQSIMDYISTHSPIRGV